MVTLMSLKNRTLLTLALLAFFCASAHAQTAIVPDTTPHKIQFVIVDKGIKLEVVDWGGKGAPLIFLAGLGDTAHEFDSFAPKFTASHHVYGVTRRGFGTSSHPAPTPQNYDADRLGDDVLAVITALKLDRPVLVGHSIAGQELSSVASRHPENVSGLIYLDAAYPYAFYNKARGDLVVDADDLRRTLERGLWFPTLQEYRTVVRGLLQDDLPRVGKDAQTALDEVEAQPNSSSPPDTPELLNAKAVAMGERKYTNIHSPLLVMFALPHACKPNCDQPGTKATAAVDAAQADFVAASNPGARVVRLPYANHIIFHSNEADVLREMNAFMDALPKR
jgi:pimeloyl-ACP methyl ester carboxylesterase